MTHAVARQRKAKFKRRLSSKVRLAARELINYVKNLLKEEELPDAVNVGGNYDCAKCFLEFLLDAGDLVDNLVAAERLMHGIHALGLDCSPKPIRHWQTTITEWHRYCRGHHKSVP